MRWIWIYSSQINVSIRFRLTKYTFNIDPGAGRVVCPNFGHPALTSPFTKHKFLHVKNSFATIVNGL